MNLFDEALQSRVYILLLTTSPPHSPISEIDFVANSVVESSSPPPESEPESSLEPGAQPEGTVCNFGRTYHDFLTGKYTSILFLSFELTDYPS